MKVLLPIVGALLYHLTLTTALITLDTIRNLTALTDDARLRIVDLSDLERGVGVSGRVLGERGNGQAVLIIGRGEDEGEVEDVSYSASNTGFSGVSWSNALWCVVQCSELMRFIPIGSTNQDFSVCMFGGDVLAIIVACPACPSRGCDKRD